MPRTIDSGLADWLDKSPLLESHSTLKVYLPNAPGSPTFYYATYPVRIGGNDYTRPLKEVGELKLSMGRAADRVEVTISNVDGVQAYDFMVANQIYTRGSQVTLGRLYRNPAQLGTDYHVELFQCTIAAFSASDTEVRLTLISDLFQGGMVGATRLVNTTCQFTFKDPDTCGYSGAGTTCSKIYDDATGGCLFYSNQHRYGGALNRNNQAQKSVSAGGPPTLYQLVKSSDGVTTTDFIQRASTVFKGAGVTDDVPNNSTIVDLTNAGRTYAINVKSDPGLATLAVGDGSTNDTAAIQDAINLAVSSGRAIYLPSGRYMVDALTGWTDSMTVFGDGMRKSILVARNDGQTVIEATGGSFHSIHIADLGIEGFGATSNSAGHGIHVHNNGGLVFQVTIRNVEVRLCGGRGIFLLENFSTLIDSVSVSNCGGNAIEGEFDNSCTFINCYVHDLATGKCAYRVYSGGTVFIGCNGIDNSTNADWAILGKNAAGGDDTDAYCRAMFIGCNVEDFTNRGIWCKAGSYISHLSGTSFWAAAGHTTAKAIQLDYVDGDTIGLLDAGCRFALKSGAAWLNGSPIHANNTPFVMLGNRVTGGQYWDTSLNSGSGLLVDLPYISTARNSTTNQGSVYQSLAAIGGLDSDIVPTIDNFRNLGSSSFRFKDVFVGEKVDLADGATKIIGANVELANGANPILKQIGGTVTGRVQVLNDSYMQLGTDTNHSVYFRTNNLDRWLIDNNGTLRPASDAASDIGFNGGRVKDFHLSGVMYLNAAQTVFIARGTGTPEGALTGSPGAVFIRTDGGANTSLYVKESGSGNTGWVGYGAPSSSGIGGSGTTGKIAKFTASGTIGNSIITESGSTVTVASYIQADGANSELKLTDTTSGSIEARFKVFTNDRAIIGTISNHDLVLFANNADQWKAKASGHFLPDGDKVRDVGGSSNFIRDAFVGRRIHAGGSAPSNSTGTGAGTSPTVTIDGNEFVGAILLTTGTTPAANAKIIDLTCTAYANYPVVMISAGNAAAATAIADGRLFVDDAAMLTNKWTLKSGATALAASTDYVFYYHVIGF